MASEKKKSLGGRPPRHAGEVIAKNRTFRCRTRLEELLRASALGSQRSVSEEIERRLEDSYFRDRLNAATFGTDVGGEILRLVGAAMAVEGVVGDWARIPERAENLRVAVNAIIATITGLPVEMPPPEKRQEGYLTAKELLLRSNVQRDLPSELMFSSLEPPFPSVEERKDPEGE
jgi:hypothetical protein